MPIIRVYGLPDLLGSVAPVRIPRKPYNSFPRGLEGAIYDLKTDLEDRQYQADHRRKTEAVYAEYVGKIQQAVTSVAGLGIDPKEASSEVHVLFPTDHVSKGLGEELLVFVDGLLLAPNGKHVRGKLLQNELAEAVKAVLADLASDHLPQCSLIEVFVATFNTRK